MPAREIKYAMRVDACCKAAVSSVVPSPFTPSARTFTHSLLGGSGRIGRRKCCGNEASGAATYCMPIDPIRPSPGHDQPVNEILHLVNCAFSSNRLAALRSFANTGTLLRTAFSNPTSVSGLFSRLIVTTTR